MIKTRQLYQQAQSFLPILKPYILTNHLPQCSNDPAMLRRIIIINFMAEFVDEPTKEHQRKINSELYKSISTDKFKSSLLKWLVIGSKRWFTRGKLIIPNKVKDYIKEYKNDNDVIGKFVNECCDINDTIIRTRSTFLYNRYKIWAEDNGFGKYSHTRFGIEMIKKFKKGNTHGYIHYIGISLKDELANI